MIRCIVPLIVLVIHFTLLNFSFAAKDSGERPKIFLEKRVIAEKAGKRVKFFEVYRIEKGDTLWKVFLDKLSGRQEEFGLFLEAFKKANPGVYDPSKLKRGTKVKLPMNVGTLGKKDLLTELKAKGKIYEHKVISGDFLWKITPREIESVKEKLKFVSEVKKLNPFLKNPDWIFPGQRLYLPRYAYFAEEEKGLQRMDISKDGGTDENQVGMSPDERVSSPDAASGTIETGGITGEGDEEEISMETPSLAGPGKIREGPFELEKGYPEKTLEKGKRERWAEGSDAVVSNIEERKPSAAFEESPLVYRGLVGDVLSTLGESLVHSGEMYIPLEGGGELVLNMENYPIVRFSKGGNLILDFLNTIPVEMERALTEKWQGYSIMKLSGDGGVESFIEKLLKRGNYYSVKQGKESQLVIGENVSLSLESDMIILKDDDSILKGEVYTLKRLRSSYIAEGLSNIYAYCLRVGIVVIPYYVDRTINDGYVVSYYSESRDEEISREKVPTKLIDGVKYIFDTIGIRSLKSHKISIKGPGGAFTLTIRPELVFWVGNRPHVLDPERFTEPIIKLLQKEGYKVVRVGKNRPYSSLIPEILQLAEKPYTLYEDKIISGGVNRGYTIKASGIMIGKEETGGEHKFLFVKGDVDLGMRELLSRHIGIRIITY